MKIFFGGIFVLSFVLYLVAPGYYSLGYCSLLLSIFIFSSILFLRKTKGITFFNFHMLFIISMFFVNFVYPVFLRPINIAYFPVFNLTFNENIITKATALVQLGTSAYMLGAIIYNNKKINHTTNNKIHEISYNRLTQFLIFISYCLFIIFLLTVGSGFFKGVFSSYSSTSVYILIIFQPVLYLTTIVSVINMKRKSSMSFISYLNSFKMALKILFLFFILSFLFVGDRGPVLYLLIIILGLYSYLIKPLKLRTLLPLLILGMFIMTFISHSRTTDSQKSASNLKEYIDTGKNRMNLNSFFDLGMDLIVNNRNLYFGMDYVDKYGINYGKTMVLYPLSIIPGLQGFIVKITGVNSQSLSTAHIITTETFEKRKGWGLGTNLIVDIYMAFGTFGVVVLMFILGFFIQKLQNLFIAKQTSELTILYMIMLSLAIYLPRAEFLHPIRPLVWSYISFIALKSLPIFKMTRKTLI